MTILSLSSSLLASLCRAYLVNGRLPDGTAYSYHAVVINGKVIFSPFFCGVKIPSEINYSDVEPSEYEDVSILRVKEMERAEQIAKKELCTLEIVCDCMRFARSMLYGEKIEGLLNELEGGSMHNANGCEFCTKGVMLGGVIISRRQTVDFYIYNASCKKAIEIRVRGDRDCDYYLPISFCPICGQDLLSED